MALDGILQPETIERPARISEQYQTNLPLNCPENQIHCCNQQDTDTTKAVIKIAKLLGPRPANMWQTCDKHNCSFVYYRIAENTSEIHRLRPPRRFHKDHVIRPYNGQEAAGYEILLVL